MNQRKQGGGWKRPQRKRSGRAQMSAYRQLNRVYDNATKNLLRGIIGERHDTNPYSEAINNLRNKANAADLATSMEIIFGKDGSFPFKNTDSTYQNLLRWHSLNTLDSEREAAFVVGHINGWVDEAKTVASAMETFASLPESEPGDATEALSAFAEQYGASTFVARKIAYLMSRFAEDPGVQKYYQKIATKVQQAKYSAPYFIAMEVIDPDFPYFANMMTRVQILSKYSKDDFRRILPLHDLVPTPLTSDDAASFLRKSHSCSLVDEILAVIILLNLEDQFTAEAAVIKKYLNGDLLTAFQRVSTAAFDAAKIYDDTDPDEADIIFYRRSYAFCEFKICAHYRQYVDSIVAPRIMPKATVLSAAASNVQITIKDLTHRFTGFRRPTDFKGVQSCGNFLRTVQFLQFLNLNPGAVRFNAQQIRFIFEHTLALEVLLRETELEAIYALSDDESKLLVSVLALALHKSRLHDDDVDFKFRYLLGRAVSNQFDGKIENFIEWLLPSTPQIANYMASILDRQTLQKMYWIIGSADEADAARQAILRSVGKQRGEIRYFIEADSIEASRQVAKLQKYFDDSRIYVDGFAMKTWLASNPSGYAQQYIRMIDHSISIASAQAAETDAKSVITSGVIDVLTMAAYDYVLVEAAKSAFDQFCTNREFGIESYLGRRIRHNTLTNMMRGGVEDLIEQPQFRALTFDKQFLNAVKSWSEKYRANLEHIRRDVLQFKTDSKPKGIFSAELRNDDNTISSIAGVRAILSTTRSSELLNELLIRVCWQEINPQLINATKIITVDMLSATNKLIDDELGNFDDDAHRQFKLQLREAVHERYTRLGSWFRQPEDGFVNATTRELADLIMIEILNGVVLDRSILNWHGNGADFIIGGLAVHRMYDCLSVLLRNANKYGDPEAGFDIDVEEHEVVGNFSKISVKVRSKFKNEEDQHHHARRLQQSFESTDLLAAMSVEGYSGIRKLRYITKASEGVSTASFTIAEGFCDLSFSLTAEKADPEAG